uniref:Feline leukemia virus subgroup C receptor-related protein 2 n=1 Tax=Timema bartmani TaxID=61472 RepID=A0A7R9EXH2_9NEOP|nr:unnamed protein product [Timema bartmani]
MLVRRSVALCDIIVTSWSPALHLSRKVTSCPVHCGPTVTSCPVLCFPTVTSCPVHCGPTVTSCPVHCGPTVTSCPVHCGPTVTSCPVHCDPTVTSCPVHCGPTVTPCPVHCAPTVTSCPVHCGPTVTSCLDHVVSVVMINGLASKPALQEVQVFRKRWLMLLLFVICSTCNAAHWVQFSIISNIVTRYYGVSTLAIDWTSMVYMAAYIPLVLPAAWLLDKKGLRLTLICGAIFMTAGSWIKVASVSPDRFYVAFIGQIFVGAAQIFILGVPARLAAVWFGPTQVSTATSIGVFGNQVGIALSFLLPPVIVGNHDSLEDIGKDLMKLYVGLAAGPSIILILILLNKNFLLLLASYGINVGVFYAVSTLLNQVLLLHFKNAQRDGGLIGLTMVLAGVAGSIIGGVVLDKTHKFKPTTMVVYCMALVGMVGYTFTLQLGYISLVFVTGAFLGFFMTGYLGIGYEFAAELTYPEPEGTSSGIMNAASEIFGVTFTLIAGEVLDHWGDLLTNLTLTGLLTVGLVMTVLIRGKDLRRQAASKPVVHPSELEMLNISSQGEV